MGTKCKQKGTIEMEGTTIRYKDSWVEFTSDTAFAFITTHKNGHWIEGHVFATDLVPRDEHGAASGSVCFEVPRQTINNGGYRIGVFDKPVFNRVKGLEIESLFFDGSTVKAKFTNGMIGHCSRQDFSNYTSRESGWSWSSLRDDCQRYIVKISSDDHKITIDREYMKIKQKQLTALFKEWKKIMKRKWGVKDVK